MSDPIYTPSQAEAIRIAHSLADMGVPIFAAYRDSSTPGEFLRPNGWQHTKAGQTSHNWIDRWRPGMALCAVTGVVFDVIDVDPRNGGRDGAADLFEADAWPATYGMARTPSEGEHHLIARTHLRKGKPAKGIDLQAGDDQGEGRGYIYIAPTVRPSKFGAALGQDVEYRWEDAPEVDGGPATLALHDTMPTYDPGLTALIDLCTAQRAPRRTAPTAARATAGASGDDLFDNAVETWTAEQAERMINEQLVKVRDAREGEVNSTLGGAARVLGRFVAGGYLSEEDASETLTTAVDAGNVHSDAWNLANGKKWTAATVIANGLANGSSEPWTVAAEEAVSTPAPSEPGTGATPAPAAYPPLLVESAATMAYWLQQDIGQGRLGGFFARDGQVVHTPRVGELGYVPPASEADANGPAEVRPVTPDTLAAKIQFMFRCYKNERVKGADGKPTGETREVPALFPTAAAKTVVNAPEALGNLRALKGVTHTPMVRADGSILAAPGYDDATGFLFLPGLGVDVPNVPEAPDAGHVESALTWLVKMTEGFPFATADDRANYFGLLLTPLLRELAPPSYKLFGIGAHQPGSGKSLLADIARQIHGGALRSEVPEDEAEWRKMTMSLLAGTSAPVVVLDNITGILRSSTLAGLLTASGDVQDRELGSNRMITTRNDRTWIVTGNNLSLGGDLVRRTITVMIDPNMANPETRTGFAIQDLPRWVDEHRNEILWSLLVLVRAWVAAGRPLEDRKQSDSYAHWEKVVGGILSVAGVPGAFDAQSGQRAAAGGDDDGLALVLDNLRDRFGDKSWSVAEALSPPQDGTGILMRSDTMDWVPSPVLDKLSRSEASGRASMGKWLRFRLGRWVTNSDGAALVLREVGKEKNVVRWVVETR